MQDSQLQSSDTPSAPSSSAPTNSLGAPSLGAADRNPRLITPPIGHPAWDDPQPAAWRAFGEEDQS